MIHSTVAPRSHAAEIACAIGTARSGVWSSVWSCTTTRSGEPRKPRTQAARTRARTRWSRADRRQAGQAEQAGKLGGVGDHSLLRPVEMVGPATSTNSSTVMCEGQTSALDHGADAAAAMQALARRARRPVDAEEAHVAGRRVGQADAEIDQHGGVGLVVDLDQRHLAARQFEVEASGRPERRAPGRATFCSERTDGARMRLGHQINRLLTSRMASAERTKPRGTSRCSSSD